MSNDLLTPPTPKEAETSKPPTPAEIAAAAKTNAKPALTYNEVFAKGKATDIVALFSKYKAFLEKAAPKMLSEVEREVALVAQWLTGTHKTAIAVRQCSADTVFGAIMTAVTSGLSIAFDHYALIPYGGACQFQLQYQGINHLVRNYGDVMYVTTEAVYEGDKFSYELGLEPKLLHVPGESYFKQQVIAAYATIYYKDGRKPKFKVLSRDHIEHLRRKNKSQGENPSGAWATDYGAMACAKAAKQVLKLEPKSVGAANAFTRDGAVVRIEPDNPESGYVRAEFAEDAE